MRALFVVLALLLPTALARAADLEIGFGRRSLVTERRGVTLAGYGGRGLLPAMSVHDPTFAKVMVVRTPGRAVAVVTLDLVGVQRTMLEALRARPLPLPADDVFICASHTHAGYGSLAQPTGALGLDALFFAACGPFDRAFFEETVEKVRAAIVDAWADARPARLGAGAEVVAEKLSRNRGRAGAAIDPEIGIVRVTAPDGRVRGLLVSFAAHPTVLGAANFALSADYPGALQRALEERFPGTTAMFLQGAAGDLSPTSPPGEEPDEWAKVEAIGRRLADHAARIQAGIETAAAIRVESRLVERALPRGPGLHGALGLKTSLFHQVRLGDALLIGIPGEPCARIGLDLKAAARARGVRVPLVVGLAQDHAGYFVHEEDYAHEGHDYEKRLNFYGPRVGHFFVDVHFGRDF